MGITTQMAHTMPSLLTLPLLCAAGAAAVFTNVSTFDQLQSAIGNCNSDVELRITNSITIASTLQVDYGCNLFLLGAGDAIALDGDNNVRIMSIGRGVKLLAANLIFWNSASDNDFPITDGGAVYADVGSTANFENCIFTGN